MKKLQSNEDIKKAIRKKKNIIIYGAGVVGAELTEKLLLEYPDLSLFIAVTAKDSYPYYLLGRKVFCIEELSDYADESVVIIATLEQTQDTMADNLQRLGFPVIYGMSDEFFERNRFLWKELEQFQNEELIYDKRYAAPYLKSLQQIFKDYHVEPGQMKQYVGQAVEKLKSDKLNIARLVVVLGNKCSLRCKDCNNLMTYFKPQTDLETQKILHSLELLAAKADTILKCELIGGEPFLSANLDAVLEFILSRENIYQIEITTNGTILPKQGQISLLQNKKVKVRISDYGALVDKQKIIGCLEEYHIHYEILTPEKWIAAGGVDKRGRDMRELQKIYNNCHVGQDCKTLYEDKLFACARAASLYALGYMKEQEYIEIGEQTSTQEIKEFLLKTYSEACDYCDRTEDLVYVEPAVQL